MFQLIYSSRGSKPYSAGELRKLLAISRRNNLRVDVTGMLLYHEGTFLQVLEGEEQDVIKVFERIQQDERHEEILLLQRKEIEERSFDGWEMGFCDTADELVRRDFPGFTAFLNAAFDDNFLRDGDAAREVLVKFKHGAWHREAASAD